MVTATERMRRAVAAHASAQAAACAPPPPRIAPAALPIDRILGGEWHDSPHGPVFIRDEWFPETHLHGRRPLADALAAPGDALSMLAGVAGAPPAGRFAFFDIETTGLAGGAGTYVIIAGLGSFEDGGYRMRQYFLADVGQEPAMLAALCDDLTRFDGLVTYNGRSFDVPVAEARLTLARLRPPWSGKPHIDLLHPVRRLYRHRMPACRLADAERRLLRIERHDDVPGALIPALYFDYVRAGRAAPLRAVLRHNADDVMSLAGVLAALVRLISTDDLDPDDAASAARWWERAGDPARAAKLYGAALPWLEGGDEWPWAAARHARLCRSAGDRAAAAALWSKLWREHDDARAGLELAKHLEHHARDYAAAEGIVVELMQRPDAAATLDHRLLRIRRKRGRLRPEG